MSIVLFALALAAPGGGVAEAGDGWIERAAKQTLSAACEATLATDVAVIQGGVSATSLKPSDAASRIDRQLGEMRKLAAGHDASLLLLERVRAVRVPDPGPNVLPLAIRGP